MSGTWQYYCCAYREKGDPLDAFAYASPISSLQIIHTYIHKDKHSSSPLLSIISESYDMAYLAAANTQAEKTA